MFDAAAEALKQCTGQSLRALQPASGGCIHHSFIARGTVHPFFIKLNGPQYADAFAAEADGLEALSRTSMRVPTVLGSGIAQGCAYLLLEFLELHGNGDWNRLGRELAEVHSHAGTFFGWHRDNHIGLTAQLNGGRSDWIAFWSHARLRPQLLFALQAGHDEVAALGEALDARLSDLLSGHAPTPSLLHGDLWSGNAAFLSDGTPVLFDPAVYYGDPEADIAMTHLFGGFPSTFYAGYRQARPAAEESALRTDLYNLYHVLNHLHLFGGGYLEQSKRLMRRLLQAGR